MECNPAPGVGLWKKWLFSFSPTCHRTQGQSSLIFVRSASNYLSFCIWVWNQVTSVMEQMCLAKGAWSCWRVMVHMWILGGWGPRRVCGASWHASPAAKITVPEKVWCDESTLRKQRQEKQHMKYGNDFTLQNDEDSSEKKRWKLFCCRWGMLGRITSLWLLCEKYLGFFNPSVHFCQLLESLG